MNSYSHAHGDRGFTIIETIVSTLIASIALLGVSKLYALAASNQNDHRVRTETILEAQAILQTMGNDIKSMGNGVPFDQANFQVGEDTLSDPTVTQPIIFASSTETTLALRVNESGEVALLTGGFDPAATSTLVITNPEIVQAGDPIYISNHVVGGDDGLYATVTSVNTATGAVTLTSGSVVASPSATFDMGSTFEVVPIVTYANTAEGITRNSGFGEVVVGANSTFSVEYHDAAGSDVALPLTDITLTQNLRALRVTVTTTHPNQLSSGEEHTVSVPHHFALRNLNILF